jgi:tetratricopeptide (TPR) repeat protein
VLSKSSVYGALIGSTLSALLLTGSLRVAAPSQGSKLPPELTGLREQAIRLVSQGRYYDARKAFLSVSSRSRELGLTQSAAMNLLSGGNCLYIALNFSGALKDFEQAQDMARRYGALPALAASENNLASLYLHMGEFDKALRVSTDALDRPEGSSDPAIHGKLVFQRAIALAELNRFGEAEPYYKQAIEELTDQNDLDSVARIEGELGAKYLKENKLDQAELALNQALWLVRIHRLNASANVLASLAELRSRQGDPRSAATLYDAALAAPPNITPVWMIRSSRGRYRLENRDYAGALEDFREARRVALEMRADMVPADQDRVLFEKGLSSVMEGLVDAGNLLALRTGDRRLLSESFDAAEQDRMWSLRALVPSPNDWRSRLPDHYWELLAQYQALERTSAAGRTPASERRIEDLRVELQRIEAAAAGDSSRASVSAESALAHAQSVLPEDGVLFSFLVTDSSAWVWAVDRHRVEVFALPPSRKIKADAGAFAADIRSGKADSPAAGEMWRDLFASVPAAFLNRRRWLIEPDGPLNNLPFAALRDDTRPGAPVRAVERAAIETIPGALLLEQGSIPANAPFLGVGDPVYNSADPRYAAKDAHADLTLPRLPATAGEIEACSRAWAPGAAAKLMTGTNATASQVTEALRRDAPIVHFATHVVSAPGEFNSGLIALSLDDKGAMGLLGPREILARPVSSSLVVMNGCHSAQGESLPGAGLMGLTRAWIGAGAKAVIATSWDVPDNAAESIMTDFYRALREAPERGAAFALREAQNAAIRRSGATGSQWAAYSLLSRIP